MNHPPPSPAELDAMIKAAGDGFARHSAEATAAAELVRVAAEALAAAIARGDLNLRRELARWPDLDPTFRDFVHEIDAEAGRMDPGRLAVALDSRARIFEAPIRKSAGERGAALRSAAARDGRRAELARQGKLLVFLDENGRSDHGSFLDRHVHLYQHCHRAGLVELEGPPR